MFRGFLVAILVASTANAFQTPATAQTDPDKTFVLNNGRLWNSLPVDTRALYLEGLMDGWDLRGDTEDLVTGAVAGVMGCCGGSLQYDDLAKVVSSFYALPENLRLPIGWVVMAAFAVERGGTTRDVVLAALRKHLSDVDMIAATGAPVSTSQLSPVLLIVSLKKSATRR